ncbi:MAG: Dockerin type domain, partial [Candidatus Parcubacteria bacterium]
PTRAGSPTRTPTPGGPTIRPSVTPTFGACSTTNVPTNLTPQGQLSMQSAGSYMFTWDAQQGAIKYSLRIDDLKDNFAFTYPGGVCQATNEGDVCIDNLTNNNFQFTLTPGHTYKWWVHPVNSCNAWDEAATVDLAVVNQPTPTFTPPANPSPTVTITGEPTQTPTPEGPTSTIPPTCPLHSKGDANCDGQVDFIDFEIWRQESMGEENTKNADFNGDVAVDFVDFEIWRQGYFDESPPATPTAVATIACGEDTLRCAAPPEGCQYEGGTQCTCGNLICVTTPTISPEPTLTCTPRPACLDTDSTCATEPTAGWCPILADPTLTPTPFR